jgi:hypothetical protein
MSSLVLGAYSGQARWGDRNQLPSKFQQLDRHGTTRSSVDDSCRAKKPRSILVRAQPLKLVYAGTPAVDPANHTIYFEDWT